MCPAHRNCYEIYAGQLGKGYKTYNTILLKKSTVKNVSHFSGADASAEIQLEICLAIFDQPLVSFCVELLAMRLAQKTRNERRHYSN